jgi:hypothetical protein
VMEYLEGESLANRLKRQPPLTLLQAVRIARQTADALEAAHSHGIIHRDLKPEKIFLVSRDEGEPQVKILEFGSARFRRDEWSRSTTRTGGVVGTAKYMSPEQARGARDADPRADIYSLGCVLYEMLSGHPPFDSSNPMEVLVSQLTAQAPSLRALDPRTPAALEAVVLRALAKGPEQRQQSMAELEKDLDAATAAVAVSGSGGGSNVGAGGDGTGGGGGEDGAGFDDVQFTIYRPKSVVPGKWHTLLAFAHLAEKRPDAPEDEPDPADDVRTRAQQLLGEDAPNYADTVQDSGQPIPLGGDLSFVPNVPGIEFNPPRCSFSWAEPVHQQEFRLRAPAALAGQVARGRLTVLLAGFIVAEFSIAIRVEGASARPAQRRSRARDTLRPYRHIFASYSHQDQPVVELCRQLATGLGDRYLIDCHDLRAGEEWGPGLERLIREADVFQLFWSQNSMASPHVRREWEYALGLEKAHFVRPTYWQDPLPRAPGLPPAALEKLQFERIELPKAVTVPRRPKTVAHGPKASYGPGPAVEGPQPASARPPSGGSSPTLSAAVEDSRPPAALAQRHRGRWLAGLGASATVLLLFVYALIRSPPATLSSGDIDPLGPIGQSDAGTKVGHVPPPRPNVVIAIESTPPGATVRLDGREMGRTPLTFGVPGAHITRRVTVVRKGYAEQTAEVMPSTDQKLTFTLQRLPARVAKPHRTP